MKKLVQKVIAKLNKKSSFDILKDLKPILINPPKDFKEYIVDKYKLEHANILVWFLEQINDENNFVSKANISKGKWLVNEIEKIKGQEFVKAHVRDNEVRKKLDLKY